jgi:hypothetical protein
MHPERPILAIALLLVAGCDVGGEPRDVANEPDLHAIATYPANGDGTECGVDAPDDCGVPPGTPIEIRFDRFLLPKTASLASIRAYSSGEAQSLYLMPTYDVVERVVTFRPAYGYRFLPGLLYQVVLFQPRKDDGAGFRAFDGAPLAQEGSVPLRFSFRMSRIPGVAEAPPPEREPTCAEALELFERGGCTACHASGRDAPLGLRLDSGSALQETAVGQPSREVEGPDVTRVLVDPARFGLGQSRIEPGSPSRSYLMYKLLVRPENFGTGDAACKTTHLVALPDGTCLAPTAAERARAAEWFVRLDPMPLHGALPGGVSDLRLLSDFIRAGADTGACEP